MCLSLRKFRTAAREILELKLRKPRPSREVSFGEQNLIEDLIRLESLVTPSLI